MFNGSSSCWGIIEARLLAAARFWTIFSNALIGGAATIVSAKIKCNVISKFAMKESGDFGSNPEIIFSFGCSKFSQPETMTSEYRKHKLAIDMRLTLENSRGCRISMEKW